jgi:hypothetical protein
MAEKEDNHPIDYTKMYDEIKASKPVRKGSFLGEEKEKFYVAKSEKEIYELSALAYYVWLLCDGQHSVEEIAEKISSDVQVDLNEVYEPLVLSLKGLREVGLVDY